jgi:uncharacterized membrane protein YczE
MRLHLDFIFVRRFARLMIGLLIYGLGIGMMVHARVGIAPWDVFAQGISVQTKLSFGISSVIVSAIVLLCWIPLRQKMGIGTVLNAVLIGIFADLFMPFLPVVQGVYWQQILMFVLGMCIVALATGIYISSQLGSGPRDGLMIGTQKLTGWPFWLVRTTFEGTVLTLGWLMGGQVREGTLIFAVCIGYLMQTSLQFFGMQGSKKPKYPLAETGE